MLKTDKRVTEVHRYPFPFHYLPHIKNGAWHVGQHLFWGFKYLAMIEVVCHLVASRNPRSVLDFGCGDGRLVYELASRGIPKVTGIDISERAILFAKAATLHLDNVILFQDLTEVEDEKFDVIVAMEVLEHIEPSDCKRITAHLASFLDTNGVFIVTVPTTNVPVTPRHYRHFTLETLEETVGANFSLDSVEFFHRVGITWEIVRRMTVNRFFMAHWVPWLKLAAKLYRRLVIKADASNGANIIAIFRKRTSSQQENPESHR